tara:strand:- start:4200 stop:5165 length:966 start_codon:yes stop_codon:yes gene_type:complete
MRKLTYATLIITIFFILRLFIFSSNVVNTDHLHQNRFLKEYNVFSIIKPNKLTFAGELVPYNYSQEIWERLDKELLKNTYWQSNTMLYLKRVNKYFPIIEDILEKNNIPEDFKYLAVIESGLENVVSPSGATGFWQILKGTAKEYGLEVNAAIDERYHLEKSTQVACDYLNAAYKKFNSWTMAAASYNMGQNGIQRAIDAQGTDNYYNLYLNSETSRYVFRILAVKEILENPKKYGFIYRDKDLYHPQDYTIVRVDSTISNLYDFCISKQINYKLLRYLNPWIRKTFLPDESRKIYYIKLPNDSSLIFNNITIQDNIIDEK